MLAEFGEFLEKIIASTWNMLNSSSPWIIFSFLVAGLLHEFLKPEKIQKTAIGSGKISGVFWTTISGMFIPICSCGTIPLGISMYYSGAYLGPTLAFMTSTPMINPIALLLAYGLLGKEIATIYLITGFVAPMVIGMIANKFAGNELHIGLRNKEIKQTQLETDEDKEAVIFSLTGTPCTDKPVFLRRRPLERILSADRARPVDGQPDAGSLLMVRGYSGCQQSELFSGSGRFLKKYLIKKR